jgi:magnesium transporter
MLKEYRLSGDRVVESAGGNSPILVYINPDETEKRSLINDYQVDEHTLASALDPDELSRLEFEPNHVALIFKRPRNYSGMDQLAFKASTMGAFYFNDRLIIVLPEDVSLFDGKLFSKALSLSDIILKLLYRSIYHFLEHLKIINMISDNLEQKIHTSMENRYLINLFTLEKSLVYYVNAINSNRVLIERLKINAAKLGFNQDQLELIDDIIIENDQCYRLAEIYSNILAGMMDANASIVSNNLNLLMKTLNIITIGIMVPTLVVSAFSMNVRIPLQDFEHAFWIILGLAGISVGAFMFVWWKRKW